VVATRLDEDMLGKPINKTLVRQISKLGSHPCGENGEYHTFVTEGPIFRKALKVTSGESKKIDNIWFWDISAKVIARPPPSCRCEAGKVSRSNLSRLPRSRLPSLGRQVARNDSSEGLE
jgi:hypothetical protein